ncbi:MAG TPA: FliM/FliN family flagellar motor switch protein, partial [Burkholderiaceae bacterium]
IATRRIALGVLRSLEPGDVVLPEQALESLEGAPATFRMEAGAGRGLAASAQVADGRLVLLGVPRMTDDDALAAPPTGATAIDELELPLQFELETVSITLAELESIEPGYVIEFDTPATQARLRLVSCGVVVGEADLVAVGGRLGACITHLAPRHDADQQRS